MKMSICLAEDCISLVIGSGRRCLRIRDCKSCRLREGTLLNNVIADEDEVSSVLKTIAGEYPSYAGQVNLVLGSGQVLTKILKVPILPGKALMELTKRELENFAPPGGDYVYDYSTIALRNEANPGGTILCAGMERSAVRSCTELFARCGLRVKTIDTTLNAVAQIAGGLPELRGGTFIFSVLDGRNMISLLYAGGDYLYTSRIRLLSERETGEIKDEIQRELKSILLFQETKKAEYTLTKAYLCGVNDEEQKNLVPWLAEDMGVAIEVLEGSKLIQAEKNLDFSLNDYVFAAGSLLGRRRR